jgi:transcriptional regulator with XRE-family HTH domain
MYTHAQHLSDPEVQELRHKAGLWLRELRENRGLTQRHLANLVGAEYYTFISQLENGHGRIPAARYLEWAKALGVAPAEFVRTLMKYYDPATYSILFGNPHAKDIDPAPENALANSISSPRSA